MSFAALMKADREKTQEARYVAALRLVDRIDLEVSQGLRHYRDCNGTLLTTLDQVVNAILNSTLDLSKC